MNPVSISLTVLLLVIVLYRLPRVRWSRAGRLLGVHVRLTDASRIALTFDDGPDEVATPEILAVLAKHDVRATFFMLGERVQQFPELARRIRDSGHEIAAHGNIHRSHTSLWPTRIMRDMRECIDAIERVTGVRPRLFRPPYGRATLATYIAARRLGVRLVLWSRDGQEWADDASAGSVAERLATAVAGDIVLLHDHPHIGSGPDSVADALEIALTGYAARGLHVGPIAEGL